MISVESGTDRFVKEHRKRISLDELYVPYPKQAAFHASAAKHKLLGGAAGPGKTLALIIEHMISCNEFSAKDAPQVHTLLLRRTHPKLEATLMTRFREKIPQELYRDFNETKKVVTWLNGATTQFGSMQYEHDVFGWQGQWYKIGYDELTEFTFKQWNDIAAWNRCPVSPYATKDGATNPIGVGAGWVQNLFVDKRPCDEMDDNQRKRYNPAEYDYFPCTYLDNPVYANDPTFIANLDSYQGPISEALKYGKWGVAGGYFQGAWDPAYNIYAADSIEIKPWHMRWLSGDWGFEHFSAIYAHYMDDAGIVRTYREYVTKHEPPEMLSESIVTHFAEPGVKFENFYFSHDAFAQKTDINTIALRMGRALVKAGLPAPHNVGRDLIGRGQIMYEKLKQRVKLGEVYNDDQGCTVPVEVSAWQISDACPKLIEKIPQVPRDDKEVEKMAEFTGDDPIHGAGHGIYGKFGRPTSKPKGVQLAERIDPIQDHTFKHIQHLKFEQEFKNPDKPFFIRGRKR